VAEEESELVAEEVHDEAAAGSYAEETQHEEAEAEAVVASSGQDSTFSLGDWDEEESVEEVEAAPYASLTGAGHGSHPPLDLNAEQADHGAEPVARSADELLLGGDDNTGGGAEVTPLMPGRRRGLLSGDSGEGTGSAAKAGGGGSTLFERMANLSRGTRQAEADEEASDDGDDGSLLNIPRFLGRQSNQ
jgi:cell division protein FtsZ